MRQGLGPGTAVTLLLLEVGLGLEVEAGGVAVGDGLTDGEGLVGWLVGLGAVVLELELLEHALAKTNTPSTPATASRGVHMVPSSWPEPEKPGRHHGRLSEEIMPATSGRPRAPGVPIATTGFPG
ncbi:MAG: hypothetical protein M3Z50_14935 [Actinomycetota bacterium]|nr:hypothetical protein [Actinomycetota bacterium]